MVTQRFKADFFSEEAVRLCSQPNRKDGLQSAGNKYQKRTIEKRIKESHYFSIKRDDCIFKDLKMNTIDLKNMGGNLSHSGTQECYNYRSDPYLGVGWRAF